jgi:hypothetical protein
MNGSNHTTRVYKLGYIYGGTKDPHSAMLGGHSTLNTIVLGASKGISKYQIPPHFGQHSSAARAASMQWHGHIEVLNVKVTTFILLLVASVPYCGQNQTAVSDEQQSLFDF